MLTGVFHAPEGSRAVQECRGPKAARHALHGGQALPRCHSSGLCSVLPLNGPIHRCWRAGRGHSGRHCLVGKRGCRSPLETLTGPECQRTGGRGHRETLPLRHQGMRCIHVIPIFSLHNDPRKTKYHGWVPELKKIKSVTDE